MLSNDEKDELIRRANFLVRNYGRKKSYENTLVYRVDEVRINLTTLGRLAEDFKMLGIATTIREDPKVLEVWSGTDVTALAWYPSNQREWRSDDLNHWVLNLLRREMALEDLAKV